MGLQTWKFYQRSLVLPPKEMLCEVVYVESENAPMAGV